MRWYSDVDDCGPVTLPPPTGIRVLMMPFYLHSVRASLPLSLSSWVPTLEAMLTREPTIGVGYVTIDERAVKAGQHHRRPGLHVDGWADEQDSGVWGGGAWGRRGCLMAASHLGSLAYRGTFTGTPMRYGDCDHLHEQRSDVSLVLLTANTCWRLGALTVHETVPLRYPARRSFVRISFPSSAGWPSSCTPNPLGILPTGPMLPPRPSRFTRYTPVDALTVRPTPLESVGLS